MDKSESLTELFKALSKFQGELENVEKGKKGHGYKYATLGNCIDAAKAPLANNGLSVSQLLGSNDKGESTMQTVLAHQSGEYISSICVMPIAKLAGGGSNNPAQVMGASITYMRRYQYAAIIGLAQDDTDGVPKANAAHQVGSGEIHRAVSMISQAIETNDMDYIKNNWAGSIAKNWQHLNEVQVNALNTIFNKLNKGNN